MAATQRRIAGASNPAKPASLQPAAHDIHVGAGAEPDKESLHAFGAEQIDVTPDTVAIHARFGAAQIDAIEIGGWKRTLTIRIDGDVTIAEGRAVELLPNEAIRLAFSIQPGGERARVQREIDRLHFAPCQSRHYTRFRGRLTGALAIVLMKAVGLGSLTALKKRDRAEASQQPDRSARWKAHRDAP